MGIGLTKYGRRELVVCTLAAGGLCVLLGAAGARVHWFAWAPIPLVVAAWLWVLWFFRDPERAVPQGEGLFVSPADGRVTDITQVGPDSPLGCDGVKIGVFMNVFSVHVNRSPAAGTVRRTEHAAGAFLDARDPQAACRNESATVHMTCSHDGREYPLVVRQVAGLIARRIVTDVVEGQSLDRGERFGMIKFGSRLELMVPSELVGLILVERGQRVTAGTTVLVAAAKVLGDERHA